MKYIKHIILTAFAMVMMMGAWAASITFHVNTPNGQTMTREYEAGDSPSMIKEHVENWSNGIYASAHQHLFYNDVELDDSQQLFQLGFTEGNSYTLTLTYTDPTQPQRVDNNNWRVQTMPRGDRVLRTTWKQACELAFEKDTTVYRGFSFEGQPLTNPHNLDVTYSSSNTNVATVATDGTVTVKGVGDATITATTTGNDDYQACSASYNIQVKEPYKLTLLTVGNGTVDIDGITLPPGVIVDTAHYSGNDKHYLVKPGTGAVDLEATPNLLNYLVNWSNNVTVSNDNPLNAFVMLSDHVTVTATFAMYPILVVEKEGVGSVEVVGVTRTAQSESINTTVSGYNTFSGTLFTVNSQSYASDGKGFTIGHLADETMSEPLSATITANNHQTIIDSVKIVRQQTQTPINCSFADMTVDHGTYTYSGDTATVRGVNATSLTIGIQNEWDNSSLWISTVKVFYTDVTVVSTIDHVTTTEGDVYTIEPGTDVQLTATAGTNYHFDNWSWGTGSDAQTTNNPIYVTMPNDGTASVTRKATFAMDTYTLTLKTNDKSMGILVVDPNTTNPAISGPTINNETGTRTYTVNYGTEVVLQATPADHHHLASWSNGATLKELDTIHVTVAKDSTITANFAIDTYKLTLAKSGNGAVDTMGVIPGVVYYGLVDGNKTYIVDYNTPVTVKATADEHNHFVNWTNEGNTAYNATNVTTDAGTYPVHSYLTFNVTCDTTVQGNFAVNTYDITATVATNCNGMGTVSGGGTYNEAATVTLIATPATGYHFVNWTKTGETSPVSTAATYSFNATAATEGSYIANFAINTYTLTLATDPTNGLQGTLDVVRNNNNELPAGVTGTYPNYTVNEGVNVPLVIAPATHYHLVSLIGGTNQPINYSDNHATIAVNKDTTITATFSIDTYVITAAANNSTLGFVTVSGTSPYDYGTEVTLTAQTTDSTHFVNWTKEGETDPVSTNPTFKFNATDGTAGNYIANFAINPTLKLVADGHGTVDTVGVIASVALKSAADKEYYVVPGTVVSVKAKPDAGFVFVQWNDGKTNNPLDTTINSEVTLTATFALPTPGLTPEGELTVFGSEFVSETGEIVSRPSITETGGLIDESVVPVPVFTCGTSTVTDHEGNVYATVQIGNQCWMRDNLRTTTSPSTGTYIIPATNAKNTYTGKQACWYGNDSAMCVTKNYGLHYNWNAAVDTFNTAYGETSVNTDFSNAVSVTFTGHRRGICPNGWHVPSDAEWTTMTNYVSSQSAYRCSGNSSNIAKALASTEGWNSYSGECYPGDQSVTANNATGFSAVPAGQGYGSSFGRAGQDAYFWSATQGESVSAIAYYRDLEYSNASVARGDRHKNYGFPVRCLRD